MNEECCVLYFKESGMLYDDLGNKLYNEGEKGVIVTAKWVCVADPHENCHLTVKKIAKNLTFFFFKLPKIVIFSTKLPLAIFWKKEIFWQLKKKDNFHQFKKKAIF